METRDQKMRLHSCFSMSFPSSNHIWRELIAQNDTGSI